jgi:RecQ mediated genome instability protein
MSNRLPADLLARKRLDGTYRLSVAAVQDISQPTYSTEDITTVHGSTARHMPAEDNEREEVNMGKKRLLKIVLADATDRLLIAYEYERWEQEIAMWAQRVGNQVDIAGPITLVDGVALLTGGNIAIPQSLPPSSSSTKPSALAHIQAQQDDWIHNLPSDLFTPSTDEVIVIDE